MSKGRLLYETKTKCFYEGPEPSSLIEIIRDSSDHQSILNARISEYFMHGLAHTGIPTHFIRRLNMRENLLHHVELMPFSVFVRNRADKDYAEALDFEMGAILPQPVVEFKYHNLKGETKSLSKDEVVKFEFCSKQERDEIMKLALRANDFLCGVYWSIGCFLVDMNFEMGRQEAEGFQNYIMLSDDVGPIQSQLWDISSSDENNIIRPELTDIAKRLGVQ